MQLRLSVASVLLLIACAEMLASVQTPFETLYERADTVVVGSIESARRVPGSDVRSKMPSREPLQYARVYLCELTIHVAAPIKPQEFITEARGTVSVVSYLPSARCRLDYRKGEDLFTGPALWLLLHENGRLRTLMDNALTVRRLTAFPAGIEQKLSAWKDPDLALAYLLLKPGVWLSAQDYLKFVRVGEVIDITGWSKFLSAYRTVYVESDEHMRGQISLVLSSLGYCLDLARRTTQDQGILRDWNWGHSMLNPEVERRDEEVQLSRMRSWTSKEAVVAAHRGVKEAIDDLTERACSSETRLKQRARDILRQYFGVSPSTLPCIPCE